MELGLRKYFELLSSIIWEDTEIIHEQSAKSNIIDEVKSPKGMFGLVANQLVDNELKNAGEGIVLNALKENLHQQPNYVWVSQDDPEREWADFGAFWNGFQQFDSASVKDYPGVFNSCFLL